jgi:hypothetical protein
VYKNKSAIVLACRKWGINEAVQETKIKTGSQQVWQEKQSSLHIGSNVQTESFQSSNGIGDISTLVTGYLE